MTLLPRTETKLSDPPSPVTHGGKAWPDSMEAFRKRLSIPHAGDG
jgi:hypothetical protein